VLFLGCAVSFLTSGTLTLRLVLSSMIYWSFVPLVEIAALAAVCWNDRQKISFPTLIDSFFAGYGPWLLWLAGLSAIWSFTSPAAKAFDWTISEVWLFGGVAAAAAWSSYLDFCFFRSVLRRSRARAVRELAVQRFISWSLILSVIGAPTIWSE